MVRSIVIIISLFIATSLHAETIYQKNCVVCHANYPVKLDKLFMRYLLKYSSEEAVKGAIFNYLKKPDYFKSVMYEGFINRFGIKAASKLSDEELKEAIAIYYTAYDVRSHLK